MQPAWFLAGQVLKLYEKDLTSMFTYFLFLAHLSHRLRVSYCHWPMSVVRRPSFVVRRPSSTIALNNISSETARPRALIFGM